MQLPPPRTVIKHRKERNSMASNINNNTDHRVAIIEYYSDNAPCPLSATSSHPIQQPPKLLSQPPPAQPLS